MAVKSSAFNRKVLCGIVTGIPSSLSRLLTSLLRAVFSFQLKILKRIKSIKSVIATILIIFGLVLVYAGSTGNTGL